MRLARPKDRTRDRLCSTALLLAVPLVIPGGEQLLAARLSPAAAAAPASLSATLPATGSDRVVVAEAGTGSSAATYALTPQRRAVLATIRYAEGTWADGRAEGYRTLYGGGRFASLERHPDTVVVKRYASAAAGAYQFLPATWKAASLQLGLRGFGPANQDQAALYLIDQRGALACIDRGELSDQALDRLSREWASLPTLAGVSAYGQPVKTAAELRRFHAAALRRLTRPAAAPRLS